MNGPPDSATLIGLLWDGAYVLVMLVLILLGLQLADRPDERTIAEMKKDAWR